MRAETCLNLNCSLVRNVLKSHKLLYYPLACYEKKCIWKCRLLKSSAAHKCLHQGLISAHRQTVWTQIRLLLEEQSDLGPHCLLQGCFKGCSRRCIVTLAAEKFNNSVLGPWWNLWQWRSLRQPFSAPASRESNVQPQGRKITNGPCREKPGPDVLITCSTQVRMKI